MVPRVERPWDYLCLDNLKRAPLGLWLLIIKIETMTFKLEELEMIKQGLALALEQLKEELIPLLDVADEEALMIAA